MAWNNFNYKNIFEEVPKVNIKQGERFLLKLEKMGTSLNNLLETIVSTDLNTTNEGGDYLGLANPDEGAYTTYAMSQNIRQIELMSAVVDASAFLSTNGLGQYTCNLVDIHLQILPMISKILPEIGLYYGSEKQTPDDILHISPYILSSAPTYIVKVGVHEIEIPMLVVTNEPQLFFDNNIFNKQITQPLLCILRPVLDYINSAIKQLKLITK